jgi:phosphoesterase RecJ-like protein
MTFWAKWPDFSSRLKNWQTPLISPARARLTIHNPSATLSDMSDAYQKTIEILSGCKRVLVTTHVRPDGDALGTCAALVLGMRKVGIDAQALLLSHLPTKYSFVFADSDVPFYEIGQEPPSPNGRRPPADLLEGFDALLIADTGTWSQLPGLKEFLAGWTKPKLVLDHHLTQEDWADHKLVVTDAAAAAEIAAELLAAWEIPLDKAIATPLYVAITSDTGWFQFSNTRPYTLRLAATLMEAGVDTDALYKRLYQSERPQRLALQTRALDSLQLDCGGQLAVMRLSQDDFAKAGAAVTDTEAAVNLPLQIATVQTSMLFTHAPEGGPIRVSLRSKGGMDVAHFAQQFGGGGHARAAGLKVEGQLDDVVERVVAAARTVLTAGVPKEPRTK